MNVPPARTGVLDRSVGRSTFGTDPSGYDEARSGYPQELFEYLAERSVPNPSILEIGAGTGLATRGLRLCRPRELTLVEPDPRLCDFLRQSPIAADLNVVCGPFPDVAVDGPFDLVTCAAAFHWMEPAAALSRIRELLAPGGTWAMWWNCYFGHGQADPFGDAVTKILDAHHVSLPPSYRGRHHYALDVPRHRSLLQEAEFTDIRHQLYVARRELDARQARALYRSFSFIRVLPPDSQARILDEMVDLLETEYSGTVQSAVVTSLYSAKA